VKRALRYLPAAALLLAACCGAGCRTAAPPRGDLAAAYRAARERRLTPRTVELLENLADRHVARERQLARLETAIGEDFRRFGAADDPRFVWAHEMECYARMMHLPERSGAAPAERLKPVAEKLLKFEQQVNWAKLAACRDSVTEREAPVLALRLATGWDEARILGFDFASLPEPPTTAASSPAPAADPAELGARVVRRAAELLTLCDGRPAETAAVLTALRNSAAARQALAECYLALAEHRLRRDHSPAALAAWRIARARNELEKSFPEL